MKKKQVKRLGQVNYCSKYFTTQEVAENLENNIKAAFSRLFLFLCWRKWRNARLFRKHLPGLLGWKLASSKEGKQTGSAENKLQNT